MVRTPKKTGYKTEGARVLLGLRESLPQVPKPIGHCSEDTTPETDPSLQICFLNPAWSSETEISKRLTQLDLKKVDTGLTMRQSDSFLGLAFDLLNQLDKTCQNCVANATKKKRSEAWLE